MIPNYIRPQHRIFQLLDVTPDAPADRINALVMGPTYFTNIYGQESIPGQDFVAAGQNLSYQFTDSLGQTQTLSSLTGYELDQSSVRVWAEDVEALLADLDNADSDVTLALNVARTVIVSSISDFVGVDLLDGLDGRPVQVGDLVDVELVGGTVFRRQVTSIQNPDGLVLNLAVPGTAAVDTVRVILQHSGEVPSAQYTADGTDVTTNASLSLVVTGKTNPAALINARGQLFVEFRALMPAPADEGILALRSTQDIEAVLGTVSIHNDLAWAASRALVGSGGKRIYAVRTNGTNLAAFNTALGKISSTDMVYALAPITPDLDAQNAVSSHVESQSQPDVKNFRRCYLGFDSPGETEVMEGTAFTSAAFGGNDHRYVTIAAGGLITAGVRAGFIFKVGATRFTVQERVSDTEFILTGAGVGTAAWELLVPDTADGQTSLVADRGRSLSSRRTSVVWVHKGVDWVGGQPRIIPNRFVAAEIAGLRSALFPQQGLTRTQVTTITSAPLMYTLFSQDQLDTIAANGVFILTQDVESGVVYIRHQITTKTDAGSLFYEDSAGTNLDALCFRVKDAVEGFIGKRNVTPGTISEIRGLVRDILQDATETDADTQIGPQIISYADLLVEAHPQLKDRITIRFTVEIPLPLNNIDTYARASVGLTI